jgi:hypothetical protein
MARVRHLTELEDAYGLLDQVRIRPRMWVRSLQELENLLVGYDAALKIHRIDERFDLWPTGPFADWLYWRFGWGMACGWATAIEQHADGEPLEVFFQLLDDYRADRR